MGFGKQFCSALMIYLFVVEYHGTVLSPKGVVLKHCKDGADLKRVPQLRWEVFNHFYEQLFSLCLKKKQINYQGWKALSKNRKEMVYTGGKNLLYSDPFRQETVIPVAYGFSVRHFDCRTLHKDFGST